MKKLIIIFFIFSFSQLSFANERFIPLELFTGGEIRDDTDIKFTPADKVFGKKKRKKIVGPLDWRGIGSEEIIKIYKRTEKNREGKVRRLNILQ